MTVNKNLFIGIDLGGKNKKTTGICILEEKDGKVCFLKDFNSGCHDIIGREIFKTINPYLKKTKIIAIDAPLTVGQGKGKMRLYEKFLSTEIFRQEKINPTPPALISFLSSFARDILENLRKQGFVLNADLIETFSTFTEKIIKDDFYPRLIKGKNPCQTQNQQSALICALLAFLHSDFKTRYLGYKDGFVFFPEFSFWNEKWKENFYQAWSQRSRLRYRYLTTNLFDEKK